MHGSRWIIAALLAALGLLMMVAEARHRWAGGTEVDDPSAHRLTAARVLPVGLHRPASSPAAAASMPVAALPDNWDGQRPGYAGYLWYRIALPAGLAATADPTLYLPAVAMNAEVWLNGQRVGAQGRMDLPPSRHFYTPMLVSLPPALLNAAGGNQLDILVAGTPGYRSGLAPVWVGSHVPLYDAWRWRHLWQNQGTLATIAFNLAIGVMVGLLWWRDRSHVAFGWFGSAVVVWGLRDLNYVVTDPPLPDLLFAELCVSGAAWFVALFAAFTERFCEEEDPAHRPRRWIPALALVYAAVATTYFVAAPTYAQANAGFVTLATLGIALSVWSQALLVRLAWRRRRPELVAVAVGAATYLVLQFNDFLIGTDKQSLGEVFVRQYAALPMFAALAATLSWRHAQALRQSRELAATLQRRVDEQRAQLERSYVALKDADRERARAQERARMMGDLHDGLGLHLVTALRQARSAVTPREAVAESLQDCLDDLRVAIDSLDEIERDPLSLLASLRFRMAPRFESLGLQLRWQVDPGLRAYALDADGALHLLRIVQEALTNALKHARARSVTLALRRDAQGLAVSLRDDGQGFDPARVKGGRGLQQMQLRAARLGARLTVRADAEGTLVELLLPAGIDPAS